MFEKHYLSAHFGVFCFLNPVFIFWPFVLLVFLVLVSYLLLVFLLFPKSNICVLIIVSVVFLVSSFLGFVMCYLLGLLDFLFWVFVFFEGLRVAPYCAVLRDTATISAIPPYCAYEVFGVSTWPIGCDTPPPFLSVSPLESMRSGGAIPPAQMGYLSDTCAIPYENKAQRMRYPLCDTVSKRYCAIWGGISHWAAKHLGGIVFLSFVRFLWVCLLIVPVTV